MFAFVVGGICSLGFRWVVDSGTFWFLGRVGLLGCGLDVVWCRLLVFAAMFSGLGFDDWWVCGLDCSFAGFLVTAFGLWLVGLLGS